MDGAVAGPINGTPSALAPNNTILPPFNADKLIEYVKEVLVVTLGAEKDELSRTGSLFSDELIDETTAKLSRYAQETIVAIYVVKDLKQRKQEVLEDGTGSSEVELGRSG